VRQLPGIDAIREDALLVASELVSNAVLWAGCDPTEEIEVVADRIPNGIRIAVADVGRADRPPDFGAPNAASLGELGLRLLDTIAWRWGIERRGQLSLWAELAL
jgi:anti-sigma regulatory factor (Ser/Thr protein kinase)